jgi:aminoglycoside phosphotransferase (APT) family kinase protein
MPSRLAWSGLPEHVRAAVASRAGAAVVAARDQDGGFSPGAVARLRLADGRRVFVKAVSPSVNADSAALLRREARTLPALPPGLPVPRLLWTFTSGDWVVLGIEDVEGRSPTLPWRRDTLARAVEAVRAMAGPLTPAPAGFPSLPEFTGWRTLAADPPGDLGPWEARHLDRLAALEESWPACAAGDTLLHFDLRSDNLLVDESGAVHVVDWAHACTGAAWVDLALLVAEAPSYGDEILESAGAPAKDVDVFLCAFAGLLAERCRRPAPPGLPTIRAFQRAHARSLIGWLSRRSVWVMG